MSARVPLRVVATPQGEYQPKYPAECEPHTPSPSGYTQWHDWADRMARTHRARQCKGCGLWAIWEPRTWARKGSKT